MREDEEFVMERLDRAYASVDWVNAYPNYSLRNLPIVRSDLGPIILDFDLKQSFGRRPFRFEHMWMTHPSCLDVVQQAWSIHTVGSRAFQLKNKLSNVRRDFIKWNKEVFGKLEQEIQLKQTQLQEIQNSIFTVEDVRKEKMVREDLETLMHGEEVMWA